MNATCKRQQWLTTTSHFINAIANTKLTSTPIHLERQPVLYVNIVCEKM